MEVPRSTNAKLDSILFAASELPVNPLVDDKHREDIEGNEAKQVQHTRTTRERLRSAGHFLGSSTTHQPFGRTAPSRALAAHQIRKLITK